MGTVKGDVHDIGKNLVDIMLEGAGFKVVDLGVQVAPETFVEAIQEHKPDVVGFSAFLTTTMPMFKVNIEAIEKAGLRDDVIIMVGGAPVTQEYADVGRRRRLRGRRGHARRSAPRSCSTSAARSRPSERTAWVLVTFIEHARQEAGLRLPHVRPVRPARHRHDLPDDVPEDAAQRPVRRRARGRALRGEARDALRLGEGDERARSAAAAAGVLARALPRAAAAGRQPARRHARPGATWSAAATARAQGWSARRGARREPARARRGRRPR